MDKVSTGTAEAPVPAASPVIEDEKVLMKARQDRTRAALAKEPQVAYRAPAQRFVSYNGVVYQVEAGQNVKWPKSIVDLLEVRDRADLFVEQGRLKGSGAFIHEGALRNSADGPGLLSE